MPRVAALIAVSVLGLLVFVGVAHAGVVTFSSSTLTYTDDVGTLPDQISIRRQDNNDIIVQANNATPITSGTGSCTALLTVVTCTNFAASLTRIVAITAGDDDAVEFSELGAITGEAELGDGTDVATVVDQSLRPFSTVFRGGPGTDNLIGGVQNDALDGGDGGDTLRGGRSADDVHGGAGIDRVLYSDPGRVGGVTVTLDDVADDGSVGPPSEGDNVHSDVEDVEGTPAADTLIGSAATNILEGVGGGDLLDGAGAFDILRGGADGDEIRARDGVTDRIECAEGVDTAIGDLIDEFSDCETVDAADLAPPATSATCKGKAATVVGTEGNETLQGTSGADVIAALGGNDKVKAGGGNDTVCGGLGKDNLLGQNGKDKLYGDAGKDRLNGGGGKGDLCNGGKSKDKAADSCEKEKAV